LRRFEALFICFAFRRLAEIVTIPAMTPFSPRRRTFIKTCGLAPLAFFAPPMPVSLNAEQAPHAAALPTATTLHDLASWVDRVRYEDFPPEVIAKTKRLLMDTLGCAIGAIDGEPIRIVSELLRQQGGHPQATIIGGGWKASVEQATFLNALAIRYLDFNDYAAFGYPHHPSINVGAALAVAEMQQLTGKDLLLGIATAYEIHIRFRDFSADGPGTIGARKRGFDLPSIEAQFASAAAAGKLLGLDVPRLENALAIAGSFGNTLREVRSGGELAMAKGTAEAISSKNGTFAALLARAGMSYPGTLLDGESGYVKVIVGGGNEKILRSQTTDFHIMKSNYKMWPSIGTSQAPIAATLELRKQVAVDEIESITVGLSDFGYEQQQDFRGEITTREHADHSVPYLVARTFLDGDIKVSDFEEHRFRDRRALALADKVILAVDKSLNGDAEILGVKMAVTTRTGAIHRGELLYGPGSVRNPADDASLTRKFVSNVEGVLGRDRADRAVETILQVDRMSGLGELLEAIAPRRTR
jgi:2-methylcitrate dehydratase